MAVSLPDRVGGAQPPAGSCGHSLVTVGSDDGTPGWAGPVRDALSAEVERTADRLRSLSEARLAAAVPPYASRAGAGRAAAQALAVAAQGIEERAGDAPPRWRTVPELSDFAVGDQVAVTGHDLLAALAEGPAAAAEPVWSPGGPRPIGAVVAEAAELLAAVRRLL
ncbi:MAG: hypothetical protein QOJ49_145 [Actinomycetota bacterium]|nr:hypothetical protein [Actinomycetota bacterium]